MLNNPYSKLLLVCEAAEAFIAAVQKQPDLAGEDSQNTTLLCLMDAEDILDVGRMLAPPGASLDFAEDKKEVEERMDAIRSEIALRVERLPKDVFMDLMVYRGRRAQNRWKQE